MRRRHHRSSEVIKAQERASSLSFDSRRPRMYSSSTPRKTKLGTGYLARPKLGALKNSYATKPTSRPSSGYGSDKRKKVRKPSLSKFEYKKKPDYADTAYRDAVSRLRILLAESYVPVRRPLRELDSAGEETDNQSVISVGSRNSRVGRSRFHSPLTPRRNNYNLTTPLRTANVNLIDNTEKSFTDCHSKWDTGHHTAPPELMSFIERQEEYIEQLERESRFCRDELSNMLGKVKDVISENENLHEKQKSNLLKSVFDHLETETETETDQDLTKSLLKSPKHAVKHRHLEGPTIVFESRISELEAQLTQTRIDLKKALDENETFKRKLTDGTYGEGLDACRKQVENLQREKAVLQDTVSKLQSTLTILRDKENSTCDQVKRSLDVAEQAQYEKTAAEHEIRRLKDELERQHGKLRDAINEQSRRIADERSAVERRYSQQVEQLNAELGVQWEQTNKLQLELDKQRRENADLRRELAQKQAHIDELKKDMSSKISSLQSDIGVNGAEKSSLEQQISTLQLANERQERQAKQEALRLQAEMQSLRQRLDRADADLIHSRRENIRLTEQVAALEKEVKMNEALADERSKRVPSSCGGDIMALPPPKDERERELSTMVQDLETKHAATVAELEGMIHSQNQLMDKLSNECHALTEKLEEANVRHKEEIRELQTNLEYISSRFTLPPTKTALDQDKERLATETKRPALYESPHITAPREVSSTKKSASYEPEIPAPQRKDTKPPVVEPKPVSRIVEQTVLTPKPKEPTIQRKVPEPVLEEVKAPNETLKTYPDDSTKVQTEIPKDIKLQEEIPKSNPKPETPFQKEQPKYEEQEYTEETDQRYVENPEGQYGVDQYDPNQQYMEDQQYSDQPYSDQQYMTQEQYEQQYGQYDPNAQYGEQGYQEQNYPADQQYGMERQYMGDEQYVQDQQYTTNQYPNQADAEIYDDQTQAQENIAEPKPSPQRTVPDSSPVKRKVPDPQQAQQKIPETQQKVPETQQRVPEPQPKRSESQPQSQPAAKQYPSEPVVSQQKTAEKAKTPSVTTKK